MLLIVILAVFILGIIMLACSVDYDWMFVPGMVFGILGTAGVIVSVIALATNHIGVDGYIAQMNTRYETLVYQYDYEIYDNDNDLGKRELMVDIQNWNEDLSKRRENQDDFWIGVFIPNIYDQFEYIELSVG